MNIAVGLRVASLADSLVVSASIFEEFYFRGY